MMDRSLSAFSFYLRYALFSFREQFSNIGNGIATFLLFPLFMFILSQMWKRFNGYLGHYTLAEMAAYIGVTEVFFMTFLRTAMISRASGDFSISLSRPRSWLLLQFYSIFGRVLGQRILYTCLLIPLLFVFGNSLDQSMIIGLRLIILLIPLGVIQALYNLLFASAHVRWENTTFLALPFTKIFLVFGGVFAPISDYSETSQKILLLLPPSDLFFQPAFFTLRGQFYEVSGVTWMIRILVQMGVLFIVGILFYRRARLHHQSYGG